MAARKAEIKAIADLLMEEHEDVEALAKSIIERLDEQRGLRCDYVVVVASGPIATAYGPYPGNKTARNAVAGGKIPLVGTEKVAVVPLYSEAALRLRWAKVDQPAKPTEVTDVKRGQMLDREKTHMDHVEGISVLNQKGQWKRVV